MSRYDLRYEQSLCAYGDMPGQMKRIGTVEFYKEYQTRLELYDCRPYVIVMESWWWVPMGGQWK
jgi:hypothetical protein